MNAPRTEELGTLEVELAKKIEAWVDAEVVGSASTLARQLGMRGLIDEMQMVRDEVHRTGVPTHTHIQSTNELAHWFSADPGASWGRRYIAYYGTATAPAHLEIRGERVQVRMKIDPECMLHLENPAVPVTDTQFLGLQVRVEAEQDLKTRETTSKLLVTGALTEHSVEEIVHAVRTCLHGLPPWASASARAGGK